MKSLPMSGFLTKVQERMAMKFAYRRLEKIEDREDFMQLFYCLAWESWVDNGMRYYEGDDKRPDIYALEYLFKITLIGLEGRRKKETTLEEFYRVINDYQVSVWDMKNPNNKFAFRDALWKLRLDNGKVVRMSYSDIAEYTGMTQSSIGRSRRLDRPIKAFMFENTLYPSLKVIEEKFGITEAKARWRSKKYTLRWDQSQQVS